jgi:hypothetical protein
MPHLRAPHPSPHEQCHNNMNERTEQPWLTGTRFAHSTLGAMHLEGSDGGRRVSRAEYGSLEHIPGPMIADTQPERIAM